MSEATRLEQGLSSVERERFDLAAELLDKVVANAVDFAAAGKSGEPVRISLCAANGLVELGVENKGPLLPEEMRGQLFRSMVSVGGAAGNRPKTPMAADPTSAFSVGTLRNPNRLRMTVVSVFMNIAPTAVAQVSSPDCRGFIPKPSCSRSGSRNGVAPTPMRNRLPARTPVWKVGSFRSDRSITGCAVRRACQG